ncbi:MAG: amidase [Actinomycetota bacterium]
MSDDLARLDATAQAELVRDGVASPLELVDAAIERIEALNGELNAVIHPLFEKAREAASGGLPDGPFAGVPFLLKDLGAAFAGDPLHLGMRFLKEAGFRAPVDTYLAQRFRDAGFVTVGKTNTPELGILPTTEPDAYGPTRNPWDQERSPGGSSGGSAAAVASGMVPVAHANDGGGSIRIPASACGLVGLKPTRQRTSAGPLAGDQMSGLSEELVVSRSVRDTAAVLDAVHGPAPGDPYTAPPPQRPYLDEVGAEPGPLRVALMTTPFLDATPDAAVVEAARDAGRLLESLGHAVEEGGPGRPEGMDIIDTFLTRWMAGQAATLDQLGAAVGSPVRPDDVEPLTWALAEEGRRRSAGRYLSAVAQHQEAARMIAGWFESGFDLWVTPTMGEPPTPLGAFDDSGAEPIRVIERGVLTAAFTAILNATGQPGISLPLYWGGDGLPIGVQLAAPFGREDVLISVAAQLERARPWADRLPPTFAGVAAAS